MVKIGPYGPYLELIGSEIVAEEKVAAKEKEKEEKAAKKTTKKKTAAKPEKEKKSKAKKPKRISIPKNMDPNTIDLKAATDLLTLPREVGTHPETGEKIVANIGPFGPYLLHDKKFTSIPKDENVLEIGLNRAVDVIATAAEKKAAGGGRRGRFSKKAKK
jgi:DNA topoisomerase-1